MKFDLRVTRFRDELCKNIVFTAILLVNGKIAGKVTNGENLTHTYVYHDEALKQRFLIFSHNDPDNAVDQMLLNQVKDRTIRRHVPTC